MVTIQYIGMDFESSGHDPWGRHVPIQIGMVVKPDKEWGPWFYESLIGGWQFDNCNDPVNNWVWSEKAFGVHGIAKESLKDAPPVWAVDIEAAAWLIRAVGHRNSMFNITVGWNVAGFDRQFVTRWMPNLNRLLSYRTLDLGAVVFARAGTEKRAYANYKKAAKAYADSKLGPEGHHNALRDARAALLELEWLREPQRETLDDYHRYQRANEAPTVYSSPSDSVIVGEKT